MPGAVVINQGVLNTKTRSNKETLHARLPLVRLKYWTNFYTELSMWSVSKRLSKQFSHCHTTSLLLVSAAMIAVTSRVP